MQNRVKLNSEKCKELRISFVKNEPQFAPIVVDGKDLERVTSAKLLGLTISSNLTWNEHISDVIKKASKRLYFLVQLKRSRVPRHDMSIFYTACIRSVLTYAAPVFFYALPKYLKDELVRVEKRAMSIIWDVTKTGNGEWGMGNGEWGMGNGEWEIENGKLWSAL